MPFIDINSSWYGKSSRVSCLLGGILCVFAGYLLLCPATISSVSLRLLLLLGFALGTPLLHLVSSSRIYHEAILWGLSGLLWTAVAVTHLLRGTHHKTFWTAVASLGASTALLSRITYGMTAYLLLAGTLLILIRRKTLSLRMMGVLSIALAAIELQMWYNFERFGSIWKAIDYSYFYLKPETLGGEFNIRRIVDTLSGYFGVSDAYFSSTSPYIRMAVHPLTNPLLFFSWREQTISLTIASVWLLLLAAYGMKWLFSNRHYSHMLLVMLTTAGTLPVLLFYFITQRYAAEFLVPLVFAASFGVYSGEILKRRLARTFVMLTIVWSIFATVQSSASWMIFGATPGVDVSPSVPDTIKRYVLSSSDTRPPQL